MANTAFEAITSRQAWHAAGALPKYYAAMIDAEGKLAKADGTRPFIGIVQYGAAAEDDVATVVKGSFPAIGSEEISAGDLLTLDSGDNAGKFKVADTEGDVVYGVALTGAAAGDLFTIAMNDVAQTIPGGV